jgi:hypothetical protein
MSSALCSTRSRATLVRNPLVLQRVLPFIFQTGSGLVHPTDGQIQRLLLRDQTARPSRPSSALRSLPNNTSSSHVDSSEEDEFESFLAQQQLLPSSHNGASSSRTRPASALSQGRPGDAPACKPQTRYNNLVTLSCRLSREDASPLRYESSGLSVEQSEHWQRRRQDG